LIDKEADEEVVHRPRKGKKILNSLINMNMNKLFKFEKPSSETALIGVGLLAFVLLLWASMKSKRAPQYLSAEDDTGSPPSSPWMTWIVVVVFLVIVMAAIWKRKGVSPYVPLENQGYYSYYSPRQTCQYQVRRK
jgi:hypothetical protein